MRTHETLLEQIYDAIEPMIPSERPHLIRIRRKRAVQLFEEHPGVFSDEAKANFVKKGPDGLNGELIPNIPPQIPIVVCTVENDKEIPDPPGFLVTPA